MGCRPILLHTDAAQALGKIPVNVDALGVDYLTIVGHKVGLLHFYFVHGSMLLVEMRLHKCP